MTDDRRGMRRPPRDDPDPFARTGDPSRPATGLGNVSDTNYDPRVSGPDVREDRERRDGKGPRPPTEQESRRARQQADKAFDPKVRGKP